MPDAFVLITLKTDTHEWLKKLASYLSEKEKKFLQNRLLCILESKNPRFKTSVKNIIKKDFGYDEKEFFKKDVIEIKEESIGKGVNMNETFKNVYEKLRLIADTIQGDIDSQKTDTSKSYVDQTQLINQTV